MEQGVQQHHTTTQHTAHSTQHTAHSTLQHSTQHTAHSTQHTAHSTQHTAHSTQHTAQETLDASVAFVVIMSALPREVWRWLQSLQLSVQVRNVRRDISNGYVVAEVLSKYFPSKVQLHNFDKGSAIDKKLANWQLLQKVFTSEGIDIDPHYIN